MSSTPAFSCAEVVQVKQKSWSLQKEEKVKRVIIAAVLAIAVLAMGFSLAQAGGGPTTAPSIGQPIYSAQAELKTQLASPDDWVVLYGEVVREKVGDTWNTNQNFLMALHGVRVDPNGGPGGGPLTTGQSRVEIQVENGLVVPFVMTRDGAVQMFCTIYRDRVRRGNPPGAIGILPDECLTPVPMPTSTPTPTIPNWAGAISVHAGWNLVAFPCSPLCGQTASEILRDFESQGIQAVVLAAWESGGWRVHIKGFSANDFPLTIWDGYFLMSRNAGTWRPFLPPSPPSSTPIPSS